jgi:hypothetical protein
MELLGADNSDYELIIKLEEHFIALNNYYNNASVIIKYNNASVPKGTRNDQVCCTIEERHAIKRYAYIIKSLKAYKKMRLVDIYIVLIYTYYSLKYNEQTTDWLTLSDLNDFITHLDANGDIIDYDDYGGYFGYFGYYGYYGYGGNPKKARALYFAITLQDILYTDNVGIQRSLSSEIRRTFLELAEGKKNKAKSRKAKSRKAKSRKLRFKKIRFRK